MKIGVLLCGQARYFRETYDSIRKQILEVYHPDLYIHTWSSTDDTFEAAPWNKLGPIRITKEDIAEYIRLYNPIKYQVDQSISALEPADPGRTSAPQTRTNFTSYATSLKRCYSLVDKPYDAFIVLRSDAIPVVFPPPSQTHILVWDRLAPRNDVLDVIVCSVPSRYMDVYASLVEFLDTYYRKGYSFNYEELYHAHFTEQGLYSVTLRLPKVKFEWQYVRGTSIEKM